MQTLINIRINRFKCENLAEQKIETEQKQREILHTTKYSFFHSNCDTNIHDCLVWCNLNLCFICILQSARAKKHHAMVLIIRNYSVMGK